MVPNCRPLMQGGTGGCEAELGGSIFKPELAASPGIGYSCVVTCQGRGVSFGADCLGFLVTKGIMNDFCIGDADVDAEVIGCLIASVPLWLFNCRLAQCLFYERHQFRRFGL